MKMNVAKKFMAFALAAAMTVSGCGLGGSVAEAKSKVPEVKSAISLMAEPNLYNINDDTVAMKVEAGSRFYIGDLVSAYVKYTNGEEWSRYLTGLDATYKSSKTSVCAVEKKTGYVTPKKAGSAKITIKYKKLSMPITVKVVKKGSFKHNKTVAKKEAKLKKYSKGFDGTFDMDNAKKMVQAAKNGRKVVEPFYYKDYNATRFGVETGFGAKKDSDGYYTTTNELIYPWCAHFRAMDSIITGDFYIKYDPFRRHSVDPVTITSATAVAGSTDVELTLSRKITDLEYYILSYTGDYRENGKPMAMFYTISDSDKGYFMTTVGAIKKDSDKITATLKYAYDKDFNLYYPEDTEATASKKQLTKKLTTFRSKVKYHFYTNYSIDENGNGTYTEKDKSWTDNYELVVE